jgi:hypothetical protein
MVTAHCTARRIDGELAMSTSPAGPEPKPLAVQVYSGERLLAQAVSTLWLYEHPPHGTMAVPGTQNWLAFDHLTLVAANGTRYRIVPIRLEHAAGTSAVLTFDIA